jgi:hypothetical protein
MVIINVIFIINFLLCIIFNLVSVNVFLKLFKFIHDYIFTIH